jgi:hypothetical protein
MAGDPPAEIPPSDAGAVASSVRTEAGSGVCSTKRGPRVSFRTTRCVIGVEHLATPPSVPGRTTKPAAISRRDIRSLRAVAADIALDVT